MGFDLLASPSRGLVELLRAYRDENPDAVYLHILDADKEGWPSIIKTRRDLLDDSRSVADELLRSDTIHRSGEPLIKCAIIGKSGYSYLVHFLGAMMNGWVPIILSPRNSHDGIEEIIRLSDSRHLIIDNTVQVNADTLSNKIPGTLIHRMDVSSLIHKGVSKNLERNEKSSAIIETGMQHPGWYVHTSGSTGQQKLVEWKNWQILRRMLDLNKTKYDGCFLIATMPMFHAMGLTSFSLWPISTGVIPVVTESKYPMTGERFLTLMKMYPRSVSMVAPAILQELASLGHDAIHIASLAHRIIFGGAPLLPEIGDKLVSHGVKLISGFGTSETGGLNLMDLPSQDPQDWQYLRFVSPSEIILEPCGEGAEVRQMIVKPGPYLASELVNHYDPVGFETGDLWAEHPTIPGLWRHMGRRGFVTVLSNGEKTDNVQIGTAPTKPQNTVKETELWLLETQFIKNPLISHAIVFGERRPQNGVIIVPRASSIDSEHFLDSIWETVEYVNTIVPQQSRLIRPLVIVANSCKGIIFTDKSTIDRKRTLELYAEEIAAAYSRIETGVSSFPIPISQDEWSMFEHIRNIISGILGKNVDDQANLFDEGMDSLLALSCRSYLIPLLRSVRKESEVPRNLLYIHPSICSLAHFVRTSPFALMNETVDDERIDATVDEFSNGWHGEHVQARCRHRTEHSDYVVVLTGSTGMFGSHILSEFLREDKVSKLFCLNRRRPSTPIHDRQQQNMDDAGLLAKYEERVEFYETDILSPDLGLSADVLTRIRSIATHFVHCAWEVNFNHGLERFVNTHIAGTRKLIDLCLSSRLLNVPQFIFISSIAAVAQFGNGGAIPETIFDDSSTAMQQGYGQSKHIAERILARAHAMTGLPATILRVGQLSGSSVSGAWNMSEYIPILLQAALVLGIIPERIPDVHWMPVNIAAGIVLDILQHKHENRDVQVYHIESPYLLLGTDIIRWTVEFSRGCIKPAPCQEWLSTVQASSSPNLNARKLQEFFRGWLDAGQPMKTLSTEGTALRSGRMNSGRITKDIFAKYYAFIQQRTCQMR